MPAVLQLSGPKHSIEFKKILIATDFSNASQRALAFAIGIAGRYHAALSVVHAIPPEPRESIPLEPLSRELNRPWLQAEQRMKSLAQNPQINDLNHHLLLEQGPVWDVL